MGVYDINGRSLSSGDSSGDIYLSSSKISRLKQETSFDASGFSLIHEFTPFDVDYSAYSDPKVLNVSQAEFYTTFYDKYLGVHDDLIVTKKNLGKEQSGLYDIWCYDFKPYGAKKKVLISSGMHTYEMPASFGLARWIQEFMESNEEVFAYLRQNVYFSVIPIVNPWGFNHNPKTYGNSNGVNPARNFNDWNNAWENFPVYTPEQNEWNVKGSAPFSEAEVKVLSNWMKNNTDAEFYIDCHTGVGCPRGQYGDVWCIYLSDNPLAQQILTAASALGDRLAEVYDVQPQMHTVADTPDVINQRYSLKVVGIPCVTIEQAQGSDTIYTTVPNNSSVSITEYATQVHAYLISQLQYTPTIQPSWDYEWYAETDHSVAPPSMTYASSGSGYNSTYQAFVAYLPSLNFNYVGDSELQIECRWLAASGASAQQDPQITLEIASGSNGNDGGKIWGNPSSGRNIQSTVTGTVTDTGVGCDDFHVYNLKAEDGQITLTVDGNIVLQGTGAKNSQYITRTGISCGVQGCGLAIKSIKFKRG